MKIDASLVRGVNADLTRQALIVGLHHFARATNGWVIAEGVETEEERLALVSSLFGEAIAPHWAPQQPADVILTPDGDPDSEPERVLRDRGGRYSEQQKKRALYMLLSRSQPSAEQQLWLITVVDSFLQ